MKIGRAVLFLILWTVAVAMASYSPGSGGGSVPSGAVVMIVSGNCGSTLGSGWTEESTLNDKFPRGTVAASSDIGGTGGNDNVTPTGSLGGPSATVEAEQVSLTGVFAGSESHSHTFTGNSQENRPAFVNVIFCKKD